MVRISCSTRFHAFALAEQMQRLGLLDRFYTLYYSQKDTWFNKWHARQDKEQIPVEKVTSFPLFLPVFYKWKNRYQRGVAYDWLVAQQLKKDDDYQFFISWSSKSLTSGTIAQQRGKTFLLERGSTHILHQRQILTEEYQRFGLTYAFDQRVIDRELEEYDAADYIVIPSRFVKETFIRNGIDENKLFVNPYGTSAFFKPIPQPPGPRPLRVLYLGGMTIRKGLPYLFEALNTLSVRHIPFEAWFIGSIDEPVKRILDKEIKGNWKTFGHVDHYRLSEYLSQCDVGVQPSTEEGLSMVIPQMLACGLPVIATPNTGAGEVVTDGVNGYIVPVRDPAAIADRLEQLFTNPGLLGTLQRNAASLSAADLSWDAYGDRYRTFLLSKSPI